MTISRHFVRYLPANRDETLATIVRKDRTCGPATASQEYVPSIELTAYDLHARYRDADVERYIVRPGITLMVAYGTDQAACQLLIESQQPLVHRQQARKHMPPELVDDIIDEIVPPAVKGRDMDSLLQQAGCGRSDVYSYENVTISRSSDCCFPLKPERDESVTIRFKRQACFQAKFAVSKENKGIAGAR